MASSSGSNWQRSPPLATTGNRKRSWEDLGHELDPDEDEEQDAYTADGRNKRLRREPSAEFQDDGAGPSGVAAESSHAASHAVYKL